MAERPEPESRPEPGPEVAAGRVRLRRPTVALGDGVIVLRPWARRDVDQIREACQDPAIQCYLPIPRPYGAEDAVRYVERTVHQWDDGSEAAFAVADAVDDGIVLGAVSLAISGPVGNAAYWVAPAVRGAGLACRALRLVTAWGFDELGLGVILLEIEPTNDASIAVATGAGYHVAGRLDVNQVTGQHDHLLFSRLAVSADSPIASP